MHISGGRLYRVTIIGQHEYGAFDASTYGLKPSEHKPNSTLSASTEKSGYTLSKCFQASPSHG